MSGPGLVFADGRPIQAADIERVKAEAYGDSNHNSASYGHQMKNWQPGLGSADSDMAYERDTITARSRDLDRNEVLAKSTFDTHVTHTVGIGLKPRPRPKWRRLGKSPEWARAWSREVAEIIGTHLDSTDIDATGHSNFDGLTRTVLRSAMSSGGVGAVPHYEKPGGRRSYRTSIELVEIDRLSNPGDGSDTPTMRGGVEIDRRGRPLAYHVRKTHPGDALFGAYVTDWERIPASFDWGRKRFLHIYDKQRPGQSRGLSIISSAMPDIKMLNRYKLAELDATVANALIAVLVKSPLPPDQLAALFGSSENFLAARGQHKAKLESGKFVPLFPGDEATPWTPGRPNIAFEAFFLNIARAVGAATGLPYELIMKDFSKTNYSSARAAILEAYKVFLTARSWLATQWCDPVYELVFEEAVLAGDIPDCTADDFYANWSSWVGCDWRGPARDEVDPKKAAEANAIKRQNNVLSLEDWCADEGKDWEEVLEQIAAEKSVMERLGLHEADLTSRFGSQPAPDDQEEREEEIVQ